jgi:hypothetical protein
VTTTATAGGRPKADYEFLRKTTTSSPRVSLLYTAFIEIETANQLTIPLFHFRKQIRAYLPTGFKRLILMSKEESSQPDAHSNCRTSDSSTCMPKPYSDFTILLYSDASPLPLFLSHFPWPGSFGHRAIKFSARVSTKNL